ncbi:DoxX family protein [Ramlibacter sp. WS9]|uniref:DoxX family protein n=1 Tax=Ramlibacter sp. WS9 TaxID=1882741 RepID=UPI0011441DFA|nr:DoxX family protein [Ramlibacter sp. WS9]ROZ74968.1 DoxX family protein [Ramlibacter sp. WS9]
MTAVFDSKQDLVALLGRIFLAAIFVITGYLKIAGFAGVTGYIASKGLPMPAVLAGLTVVLELVGGAMILSGWKSRWVALVFFLWLIPTSLIFHAFWAAPAGQESAQQIQFLKNVSIMGGMLFLMAYGPGRYSVDGGR